MTRWIIILLATALLSVSLLTAREVETMKKHEWASYKQTFGYEKIKIKFPKPPTLSLERGTLHAFAKHKDVLYALTAASPPMSGLDPKETFSIALAAMCHHPSNVISYQFVQVNGNDVLDALTQDHDSGRMTKCRIIVTPNNYYILRTSYSPYDSEEHEFFLSSFELGT